MRRGEQECAVNMQFIAVHAATLPCCVVLVGSLDADADRSVEVNDAWKSVFAVAALMDILHHGGRAAVDAGSIVERGKAYLLEFGKTRVGDRCREGGTKQGIERIQAFVADFEMQMRRSDSRIARISDHLSFRNREDRFIECRFKIG